MALTDRQTDGQTDGRTAASPVPKSCSSVSWNILVLTLSRLKSDHEQNGSTDRPTVPQRDALENSTCLPVLTADGCAVQQLSLVGSKKPDGKDNGTHR